MELAQERAEICAECEHLDLEGESCSTILGKKLSPPCCGLCGCPVPKKTKSPDTKCPANKWKR